MHLWRLLLAAAILLAAQIGLADEHPGAAVYRKLCAECHGDRGEGTDAYSSPLTGKRPIVGLAKYIDAQMPEGDHEACQGEDAKQVADYIYHAFYSPAAQAKVSPPRAELTRLTVRQYENSLTDLISGFRPPARPRDGNGNGLWAEYFNSGRTIRVNTRKSADIDPNIDFKFGADGPKGKNVDKQEYAARWRGGIYAEVTGDYEFVLIVDGGARLWVNDDDTPLIDAWVRSGEMSQYRETIKLVGGRTYSLRIEFFKSKKDPPGSIQLLWKRPHRTDQVIPTDVLRPGENFPEHYVVHADFPPDDSTLGYPRGSDVSQGWDEATTSGAIETARYVVRHLPELAGYRPGAGDREAKIRDFLGRLTARAFRRPLDDAQRQFFIDRWFDGSRTPEEAARLSVLLALKSPRFLYVDPTGPNDPFAAAEHLALAAWDSLPDTELRQAAERGQLSSPDQLRSQAARLLADAKARPIVRGFFHNWLELERATELSKDEQRFGDFNEAVVSDLRDSLDQFIDEVMWSDKSDFRRLLLEESLPLNVRLTAVYGETGKGQDRAGVLTHPLVLSQLAYHDASSPIHRGVFVARNVLGRVMRPPQDNFTPLSPKLHPDLTTRQRVAKQTAAAQCQSCHATINGLGFSLERYDAIGRYRTQDAGKPVASDGGYTTLAGDEKKFAGPRDLAVFLAASEETQSAFVEQLFHYTVKQPVRAYGVNMPEQLHEKFAATGFNMRQLLVDIVVTSASNDGSPK